MCGQTNDFQEVNNYIIQTVLKIDRLQKEIVNDTNGCVSCQTSLLTNVNNTIPVAFTVCCGTQFTAILEIPETTTAFFRIESVRNRRFVTLRLLEVVTIEDAPTIISTDKTVILDLNCVCSMQCFGSITVPTCSELAE